MIDEGLLPALDFEKIGDKKGAFIEVLHKVNDVLITWHLLQGDLQVIKVNTPKNMIPPPALSGNAEGEVLTVTWETEPFEGELWLGARGNDPDCADYVATNPGTKVVCKDDRSYRELMLTKLKEKVKASILQLKSHLSKHERAK